LNEDFVKVADTNGIQPSYIIFMNG
jgi:hypothetical protein